jgi:hypothetical protein
MFLVFHIYRFALLDVFHNKAIPPSVPKYGISHAGRSSWCRPGPASNGSDSRTRVFLPRATLRALFGYARPLPMARHRCFFRSLL